jgi:hypothetical protein
MWTLLKTLFLKFAAFRAIWAAIRALFVALPVAFLFKIFGAPMLMLLAVVALPILIILALVGLPFLFVLVIGGGLLAVVFALLTVGMAVLKMLLPFILLYWVVKLIWRWGFGGGREHGAPGGTNPEPKPAE